MSLQALAEALPKYGEKDFHLVARQNDKGIWCSEVWTKRSFEPLEIQLGPWSSQLKDSHLIPGGLVGGTAAAATGVSQAVAVARGGNGRLAHGT